MEHSYDCNVPRAHSNCVYGVCTCKCHKQRAFACSSTYGPTFYLLANVQGITTTEQASRVAMSLLMAETDENFIVEEVWL